MQTLQHDSVPLTGKFLKSLFQFGSSLRASPTVPVELKLLVESENEFSSTGNFNPAETVGDAAGYLNLFLMVHIPLL